MSEAIACGRVPVISNSPRSATRYFALSERNLFAATIPMTWRNKSTTGWSIPRSERPAAAPTRAMPVNLTLTAAWTPWKGCFWTRYRVHVMAKRIIYYSDPLQDDFADNHIHTKAVDRHFFLSPPFQTVGFVVLFGVLWRCNSRGFLISKDLPGPEV